MGEDHMVKQWGFSILALGILLFLSGWGKLSASYDTADTQVLAQAIKSADIRVSTWMIHYSSLVDQPLTGEQVNQTIRYFRLKERAPFQSTPNRTPSGYVYEKDWGRNTSLTIRVIRRGHERDGTALYDLVLRVQGAHEPLNTLTETVKNVSHGLRQAGVTPHVHVSVQGSVPYIFCQRERSQWVREIMEKLGAYEVEALREATMASVSAFSPHFRTSIASNGRRMNLQIAVRSHPATHQTVITMGTPIITIEY